tara:strand:+ start:128 stop:970 length:843 start_codon:yes stop_codon:yes gene_type:complete
MEQKFIDLLEEGKLRMWLDISTYCNAGCPACHRTDRISGGLHHEKWLPMVQWSFEQFKKAYSIEFLQQIKSWEICGTFGDPAMNKDLYEICEYICTNSETKVNIDTNGSIRSADWWKKLGKLPGLQVDFAVEGINQEMQNYYRRKTNLYKILANMKAFSDGGGKANVLCIIHKHNQNHLFEIEALCREYGATKFDWYESNRFYDGPRIHFINEDGEQDYLEQSDGNYSSPGEVGNRDMMVDWNTRTKFQSIATKVHDEVNKEEIARKVAEEAKRDESHKL